MTVYEASSSTILLVDPYNDFLAEGGKLWPRVKAVAEEVRWKPGDYVSFDFPSPYQLGSARAEAFAEASWGGTFHDDFQPQPGDVVAREHWGSSGFANTDLDLQLRQHGIRRVILIGLVANTCIEATGRFGMELGYHVTPVKDATAAFSQGGCTPPMPSTGLPTATPSSRPRSCSRSFPPN
jgi:nicotinamidase-related amidase